MNCVVRIYSTKKTEIIKFLQSFYNTNIIDIDNNLMWEKKFENPIDVTDMIGAFIENNDKYDIALWLNLGDNIFINVTEDNGDQLIRYIFERFPY